MRKFISVDENYKVTQVIKIDETTLDVTKPPFNLFFEVDVNSKIKQGFYYRYDNFFNPETNIKTNEYYVNLQKIIEGRLIERETKEIEADNQKIIDAFNSKILEAKTLLSQSNYVFIENNADEFTTEEIEQIKSWRETLRQIIKETDYSISIYIPLKPAFLELGV